MATGDVTNPSRLREVSNERLDLVDFDFLTKDARLVVDALSRAALFTPLATIAAPVGLVLTGASTTVNPTGPSDGKLRINSELLVALDADGRFLVKPSGTSIDVTIPAGGAQHQVYLYFFETPAETAKRRAIPVSSPFTEFTIAPQTKFAGGVNIYVKSGGVGAILPSDVVSGRTTALVFVGIATNTAGVVAFDASAANNKLSAIKPTTTRPTGSTVNGTIKTLHDLAQHLGYEIARLKYTDQGGLSGSTGDTVAGAAADHVRVQGLVGMNAALVGQFMTISGAASAGNNGTFPIAAFVNSTTVDLYNPFAVVGDANDGALAWSVFSHNLPGGVVKPQSSTDYGAYSEPRRGLDEVDRRAAGYVTIGDGVSSFGTFNKSEFASDDLLLKAAFLAVAKQGGGTIFLKPTVRLATFAADVDLNYTGDPYVDVVIQGSRRNVGFPGDYQIEPAGFKIKTPQYGSLVLKDTALYGNGTVIEVRGRFEAHDCSFGNALSATASIVTSGGTASRLRLHRCDFLGVDTTADDTKVSAVHLPAGTFVGKDVHLEACTFFNRSRRRTVSIDAGAVVGGKILGCYFEYGVDLGSDLTPATAHVRIENATGTGGWTVANCRFRGSATDAARANYTGVHVLDAKGVTIVGCHFDHVLYGVYVSSAGTSAGYLKVDDCRFNLSSASNASTGRGFYSVVGLVHADVSNSSFDSAGFVVGTPQTAGYDVQGVKIGRCRFVDSQFSFTINSIVGAADGGLLVEGNSFSLSSSSVLAPVVSCNITNGVCRTSWRGNQHSGGFDAASADKWFGVRLVGFTMDSDVDGNTFRDIQSGVVYAGSVVAATGTPNQMISIRAHEHRWKVTNNRASGLGAGASGANMQEVVCIEVSTKGGSADAGTVLENCLVSGNEFGDSTSRCAFMRVGSDTVGIQISSLRVVGNAHRSVPLVAGTSIAAYGLRAELAGSASGLIAVNDNDWFIDSSAVLEADWFQITAGAAVVLDAFTFNDNAIDLVGGKFGTTGRGHGLYVDADVTVTAFMLSNNVAVVSNATTNPVMYIELGNAGSYNAFYPSLPGSGSAWSTSIKIANN